MSTPPANQEPFARDGSISPRLKGIMLVLEDFAGTDDHCWPSQKTLEQALGLGKAALCNALNDAEKAGLIRRIDEPGRKARLGILLLRRSRASLPAAIDEEGQPSERSLRARRVLAPPKRGKKVQETGPIDASAAELVQETGRKKVQETGRKCAQKTGPRLTGSDYAQITPSVVVVDHDNNGVSSTPPGEPEPIPEPTEGAAAFALVDWVHRGGGRKAVDRALDALMDELNDDSERKALHRRNLKAIARGDAVMLGRVYAGLLAAEAEGNEMGRAFGMAWKDYDPATDPDPAELLGKLGALAEAKAAREAEERAIGDRRRQEEEQRQAEECEVQKQRLEAVRSLVLEPEMDALAIVRACRAVGLDLIFVGWSGDSPKIGATSAEFLAATPEQARSIVRARAHEIAPLLPQYMPPRGPRPPGASAIGAKQGREAATKKATRQSSPQPTERPRPRSREEQMAYIENRRLLAAAS